MTIAGQYAKALYETKAPGAKALKNLGVALRRRGHHKLLPRVYAEYQKLLLRESRRTRAQSPNQRQRQTKILVELYRRLIS